MSLLRPKHSIFRLSLLLLSVILISSCNGEIGDFTVTPPKDWIVRDSTSPATGRQLILYPPVQSATPIFVENVIIAVGQSRFFDAYILAFSNSLKSRAQYFEQKETGHSKINNYDARWENYLIKFKQSDLLEQKVYFIKEGGNIYQIIYTTKPNQQKKFQKEVDQILASFNIMHYSK